MWQEPYRMRLFLITGLYILGAPALQLGQEEHAPHWTYNGAEGPKHWGNLDPAFATCSTGHHQSPINIGTPKKWICLP
ncbi:MAG TPA: hypothetical protein VJN92_18895 [Candidatus Acidoferrum sp.]|nr:hypothetical protein [Candidatus Acidoferrum sp.]